ncbi:MAG: thioredoxin [Clostridia bacterium]|nr:thioredoxin [Clostridia bacterium]MBQ8511213.1 thioredoxin [Clostridia bacterium]
MITELTLTNFEEEAVKSDKPVLIDFWATWCGPCRMLSPIVDEIAEERTDIKVCKVNVDNENELAAKFGVMSIPTLVLLDKGEIKGTSIGYKPKKDILAFIG